MIKQCKWWWWAPEKHEEEGEEEEETFLPFAFGQAKRDDLPFSGDVCEPKSNEDPNEESPTQNLLILIAEQSKILVGFFLVGKKQQTKILAISILDQQKEEERRAKS